MLQTLLYYLEREFRGLVYLGIFVFSLIDRLDLVIIILLCVPVLNIIYRFIRFWVIERAYVHRLDGPHVKHGASKMDLAARAGMHGIQEWLSFYFKSPMAGEGLYAENDLFIQRSKLLNTLRYLGKADLIHHTGLDYYYDLEGD